MRAQRRINAPIVEGRVFSHVTAISLHPEKINGGTAWLCRCECGAEKVFRSGDLLRHKSSPSCGCLSKKRSAEVNTKHGHASRRHRSGMSREYAAWNAMLSRCYRPNSNGYQNYGGRGIIVCERWKGSFSDFLSDMGPRPSDRHSLDRINNNGNYEPGNCRWSTKVEQGMNRRTNHIVTLNGVAMPLTMATHKTGTPIERLRSRLRRGWDVSVAVSVDARQGRRYAKIKSEYEQTL